MSIESALHKAHSPGFDRETHVLSSEAETQERIRNISQSVQDLYLGAQEYFQYIKESSIENEYLRQLLNDIHEDAAAILTEIEALPASIFVSDAEGVKLYRMYTIVIEALESGLTAVADDQFREELNQDAAQTEVYSSAYDVLSDEQMSVIRRLKAVRADVERTDAVLRELVDIQTHDQTQTVQMPLPLIDFAADVITEMESIEFNYASDIDVLDSVLLDLDGMDQLPERLDITRMILRSEIVCLARLYSIGGEMIQEEISQAKERYQALARDYQVVRLPELAYLYEERARYLQPLVELIAMHKSFYNGRVVAED